MVLNCSGPSLAIMLQRNERRERNGIKFSSNSCGMVCRDCLSLRLGPSEGKGELTVAYPYETGVSDWEWRSRARQFRAAMQGCIKGLEECSVDPDFLESTRKDAEVRLDQVRKLESYFLEAFPAELMDREEV